VNSRLFLVLTDYTCTDYAYVRSVIQVYVSWTKWSTSLLRLIETNFCRTFQLRTLVVNNSHEG